MKATNYLNPTLLFEYLDWLVSLDEFHNDDCPPPMSANQFYWANRIQFSEAGRISETLNHTKLDFDFDHRIVTIRNPKTNKGGVQKTTILPYDVKPFERFTNKFSDNEKLFPITRSTAWRYGKNASILGGMNIFEAKDQVSITGAWTHLMRSSCSKMYQELGASYGMIQRKMRHRPSSVTDRYIKVDLQSLLDWEEEHLHTCLAKPMIESRREQPLEVRN